MDYNKIIAIRENWPKKGISFKDITPLLANAKAFKEVNIAMAKPFKNKKITKVLCADARGFLFGSVVANILNAGFVVSRNPGKLPYVGLSVSYDLEYGSNTLEIAPKMISKKDRVLIVDDLLATGGSAKAMTKMVKKIGAKLVGYSFLIELTDLKARKILAPVEFHSLVKYKI